MLRHSISCLLFTVSLVLGFAENAQAHRLGEGYLVLEFYADRIEGRVELRLEDVDGAVKLDQNADGVVEDSELEAQHEEVLAYIRPRVALGDGTTQWNMEFTHHKIEKYEMGRYVQFFFKVASGPVPDAVHTKYEVLFDVDSKQRGLVAIDRIENRNFYKQDNEYISAVLRPGHSEQEIDLTVDPEGSMFLLFVKEGIWHIWIGIDHILFLIALLLPSVRDDKKDWWQPVKEFRSALWSVVKIVTLFTIAHSVTLALAALQVVELPSWIVESIIAASIVVAALDNIFPFFRGRIGLLVFCFGLFHGLGFASVLSELALADTSLVTTLFGFNIGVELGQIVIILAVFPILYLFRTAKFYPSVIQIGGSALLVLMGACWVVERVFDVTILGI